MTLQSKKIVGWITGAVISAYFGMILLIPLFATIAVWWTASKLLRDEKKVIIPAFSINAGHFLWMTIGLVGIGAAALGDGFVELSVYVIGLTWLLVKPSRGPLYLLGIFQLLALGLNGWSFAEAAAGSFLSKALLLHVIWRAMALFAIFKLFVALKSAPKADAACTAEQTQNPPA